MDKKIDTGIYELPDGRLKIHATGKCPLTEKMLHRRETLAPGATLAQAQLRRVEIARELTSAPSPEPAPPTTIADYAERWLMRRKARLKPGVARLYAAILADHILPELGHLPCEGLTREHVADWIVITEGARKADGAQYSKNTLRNWWRVLAEILRDMAVDLELPDTTRRLRGPVSHVVADRETRTLSREQLGALIASARIHAADRVAEIITLAYTGIRAGELYGLRWCDVDEDRQILHIVQSSSHGAITTTKTGVAREAAAPGLVFEELAQHRRELIAEQHPGLSTGLVFPSSVGGAREVGSLTKPLRRATEGAGIDIHVTPQVLRRTLNTLLVVQGEDRLVIRAQMGHTSEQMTKRYAGIRAESKITAIRAVIGDS